MPVRAGTGYTDRRIMALQAYNIMKQRKRQFRVSEELQAMHVSSIESAAAIAGAWQSPHPMLQGAQLESRSCGCIPITCWLTNLRVVLPWWFATDCFRPRSIVQILSTRTCRTIVVGEVLFSGPKISCKSYCTPTGRHGERGARAYNGCL